jgi:hypothetical protein
MSEANSVHGALFQRMKFIQKNHREKDMKLVRLPPAQSTETGLPIPSAPPPTTSTCRAASILR